MLSSKKKIGEDSVNRKLFNEIGSISNALYSDRTRSRGLISTVSSRSKSVGNAFVPESKIKAKDGDKDSQEKDKKSVWSWKGLKALTHVRNRRFDCCFSLQVHSIDGLPPNFDGFSFVVHWKRRDCELVTRPVKVSQGIAEFEEQLTQTCSVYGSRNGPHHSAKYESKHFLLYASLYGAPSLDLGKHRVDLSRLLPLTLEELEDEKCSGKWTTTFKLLGKAKGANMNVSFGYVVVGNNALAPATNRHVPRVQNVREKTKPVREYSRNDDGSTMRRAESLPVWSSSSHPSAEHVKNLHEVLPTVKSDFSDSVNLLYKKLDQEDNYVDKPEVDTFSEPPGSIKLSLHLSDSLKENIGHNSEVDDFSAIEHEIEFASKEEHISEKVSNGSVVGNNPNNVVEINNMAELAVEESNDVHYIVEKIDNSQSELSVGDCDSKANDTCDKESLMNELESALNDVSDLIEGLDCQGDTSVALNEENNLEMKLNDEGYEYKERSVTLDDVAESVANEFMDMLGMENSPLALSCESDPESPREKLLRQFEEDVLAQGCSLFDFDMEEEQTESGCHTPIESTWENFVDDLYHSSTMQGFEEMPEIATEELRNKTRATIMEDLETESLMHEWGLDEKAFQCSPSNSGFGSPVDLPTELPSQLPPLGEGLSSFIQTKNGGFLRSMHPALFSNSKNGGNLIMQVSNPVVVPAEMGSGISEILQHLASVGIEKLSMQANKLMPLEDITGKTMQQIELEAIPALEGPERQGLYDHEPDGGQNTCSEHKRGKRKSSASRSRKLESHSIGNEIDSEFVSLEELAPLAMDKIEVLSIEGLKVQSGMSDENTISNISTQSIGEFSAFEGKRVNIGGSLGLEGAGALQLLDIKDNGDDVDGLMGLSLTLDEWMRLDSGDIDEEDQISDRTSKILAAHHATSPELICRRSKEYKKRGKGSSRKYGFLGNNFTVALMVQLRDPFRNYEPVGTPMLALVQVERVFVPPKPKIYSTVSELRYKVQEEDDESEPDTKDKEAAKENNVFTEAGVPQFKITDVHMAGLNSAPDKQPIWGSTSQQQSGSRWLLANGMGKKNKQPLMKSKAVAKSSMPATTTTAKPGNTLWGISSRIHGAASWWK